MYSNGVQTILDYSVEGEKTDRGFDKTRNELYRSLKHAASHEEVAFTAMKEWYSKKDIEGWNKKYNDNAGILPESKNKLLKHISWCNENEIFHTPETIVNSYIYPNKQYNIKDLRLFMEDIQLLSEENKERISEQTGPY